jgi:phosphoribosylamine--glycine ligase
MDFPMAQDKIDAQGNLNILVLGGGGREHALCWKISQSPIVSQLYCAPGNGGTGEVAKNIAIDPENAQAVLEFCQTNHIDLVVIGPEGPLVAGVSDVLRAHDIYVFGPSAAAAQLEGSKGFTKDLCAEANIPTAAYGRFHDAASAHAYLDDHPAPIVIKADGLAAGKGVIMAMDDQQAHDAVDMIFDGAFGEAGAELVIEAFMEGEEASFFVITDGTRAIPLATAQDHKRVGDGDTGPNTGGMGAYSPASIVTPDILEQVLDRIIEPTLTTLRARGTPYQGVLYAGLMLTADGPMLIEYNARFGDPECQVLMMRLESDFVPILMASAAGDMTEIGLDWSPNLAMTVVMAAKGYPGSYEKNTEIKGLAAAETEGVSVFHAGTAVQDGKCLATGGRVLNVTSIAKDVESAQQLAYDAIAKIDWPNGFCRRDIGWRELDRQSKR